VAISSIHILIRYYDAEGTLVFEDVPRLGHQLRVPAHWVRWEIYWDQTLVQSGERKVTRRRDFVDPRDPATTRRSGSAGEDPRRSAPARSRRDRSDRETQSQSPLHF
jgi:hypothetical protein